MRGWMCLALLSGCTRQTERPPDLELFTDLAAGADLATEPDLTAGADLATEPDLAAGADLAAEPDLAKPDLLPPIEVQGTLVVDAVTPGGATQVPLDLTN